MELEQQLQKLIDDAPKGDNTAQLVQVIGPLLLNLARNFHHKQYYIVQTLDQRWQTSTWTPTSPDDAERTLLYAYSTLQDAIESIPMPKDPWLMALPVPVVQIIFQLLGMEPVESVIFWEEPGPKLGAELKRSELQQFVQNHLLQLAGPPADLA
ncbi:hypothetical protein GlitD10_1730 [Gloeomargarita lithophora Alchichica-D10]|uniref:Uncharacterized protein n=1 Tax=Gloeomargarita lithophora Alchichica-D10 TaxID=1188229 RepID=A0A1J0ADR9_9CYAN|nr:hypothetical protein [Gloeomargarita lithophora]APB34055.1 hypothetical protein GlitD10_1730 [Gloeomargarita lithophora Alchichica-D10]